MGSPRSELYLRCCQARLENSRAFENLGVYSPGENDAMGHLAYIDGVLNIRVLRAEPESYLALRKQTTYAV